MFGTLGYAKWTLQTILPAQVSVRLFTPEEDQLSFECNIWMFIFGNRSRWSNTAGAKKPPKAWGFFTGDIADAYRRLKLGLVKETENQLVISACVASFLAVFSSFTGLIAFVPQTLEIGLQWGPVLCCTASAVLAICNVWQPLIFAIFLVPTTPGVKTINATGVLVAAMLASILLVATFALVVGYVRSFQVVQAGSANASIIWLAVELCLMVLRLFLWSLSPTFLCCDNIRIRLDDPTSFMTKSHTGWLNEDETKIALFAFGASIESIVEFSNLTGLWIKDSKIYVAAWTDNDKEQKYLVCTTRPKQKSKGLYGRPLQGNVPVGKSELICLPITSGPKTDKRLAVDDLLHNSLSDNEGYHFPQSNHYQLDLTSEVYYWDDHLRKWRNSLNPLENSYHSLTKVNIKSWIWMAFDYWIDKYDEYRYNQKEKHYDTESTTTDETG